jgi:enterochelin esterase-like enzyme
MSRDEILGALLVFAFAVFVTTHVALAYGLSSRQPRWQALVALLVPPLAPYWGWRALRGRTVLWGASFVAYAVLLAFAVR